MVSATTVAVVTASDCSAEYLLASLRNLSASDNELALSMSNNERLSLPPVLLNVNSTEAESVLRFRSLATGFVSTVVSVSDFSAAAAIVGAAIFVSDSRSVLLLLDEGTLMVAEIDDSEISLDSLLGFSLTGDDTIAVARMGEAMIDDEEVGDVGDGIVKDAVSLSSSLLSSSLTEVLADGVGGTLIVYDAVIWFVLLLLLLLLLGCSADPVETLSSSAAFIEGTRSFTVAEGVLDVVVVGNSLC